MTTFIIIIIIIMRTWAVMMHTLHGIQEQLQDSIDWIISDVYSETTKTKAFYSLWKIFTYASRITL